MVERERVFPPRGDGRFADRRLAAEAGLQFLRHIADNVDERAQADVYRKRFVEEYGLAPPTPEEGLDPESLRFLEFATAFGNDWFSIPVDGVPLGSLTRFSSLVVRDTFGRETEVGPFAGEAWRVFHLSGEDTDGALLLPPVVVGASEAPPLEEVVLLRDEMANMGWAVERTVAGATGRPLRRQENQGETQARGVSGLSYRLMTGVPEFWIPLVPRELQGSPRLARVAMRRMAPDGQPEEIPPRGRILGGNELLIHDEEVPRDGANVTRAWQLARDPSGQTHLWIGRSKGPAGERAPAVWPSTCWKRASSASGLCPSYQRKRCGPKSAS